MHRINWIFPIVNDFNLFLLSLKSRGRQKTELARGVSFSFSVHFM